MSGRRLLALIAGLLVILAGGAALLRGGPVGTAVGAIFTIFGTLIAYLQIFLRFPFASARPDPGEAEVSGTGSSLADPAVAASEPSRVAVPSRLHGIALLLAAPLIFASDFIALWAANTSRANLAYVTLALAAGILAPIGFAGFSGPIMSRARKTAAACTVLVVTNWLVNDLAAFVYLINFRSQAPVPAAVFSLFKYDALAAAAASLVLAAAVRRGRYYPEWIAWLSVFDASVQVLYFIAPTDMNTVRINDASGLALAVAFAVISYKMLTFTAPAVEPAAPDAAPG